ncbi:transcription termination factor NusA [Candidatus Kaiserbacteria bacterium RIFCSPHIGHO2_02_FULL_50_50]|uniref:Transcription termination/antitermination protein NusA n=1 Tax=Candidatus Kaiserbacteria bacterium RIFCSPHIGHO2_02_FULL_50_50 TaxID=1798492 RepID=A0A1F6DDM0_9BACT|nr:MAG: transcription termination factor NusA [Candidatus Kaiserbacteria bacterium RIFCSPHIGHO2_02_FULL_50_50]OGG89124.1 MAG: transcription termination factor NusA [Candidatus Kaiserbacteria bacterium RIFCSPLOWO2_12_FULL_50_10]
MLFDIKAISAAIDAFEEEKGIDRATMIGAIESALATAYKREYGKKGQIVRSHLDMNTGATKFEQIKTVVDESTVRMDEEEEEVPAHLQGDRPRFDRNEEVVEYNDDGTVKVPRYEPERHLLIQAARLIKKDVQLGDELVFPLDAPDDEFGRIAAQAAKQVVFQKVREAERGIALRDFSSKEGEIITGQVQRFERGNLFIELGRVVAIMPYAEQIPGERYKTGDRITALVLSVEEGPRGVSIKLSRAHPDFLVKLFMREVPELASGAVVVKAIAREAGQRSKIAVAAEDPGLDPVGALIGQRGVRVSAVTGELSGERVDVIEYQADPIDMIEAALAPARVEDIEILEENEEGAVIHGHARVIVAPDQQSLAIGRSGQNVRLAAKLINWKIDIESSEQEEPEEETGETEMQEAIDDIVDGKE